jgi:hypothetical protein
MCSWTTTTTNIPQNFTGELPDMGLNELTEYVKAIRNRCDIYLDIIQRGSVSHAIYTLLEDLYEDAQLIADEYCAERNGD